MQKSLPNLWLHYVPCIEDFLDDSVAIAIDSDVELECYPVFSSVAALRVIVRPYGSSKVCAEFNIVDGEDGEFFFRSFVAFSELGERYYDAILSMPNVEAEQ